MRAPVPRETSSTSPLRDLFLQARTASRDRRGSSLKCHRSRQHLCTVSVSVSAQDGIAALGKAHTRSVPFLNSLSKVALETVPIFVWLNTDRSQPCRDKCRPLPFSTPLSFRRSMLWCSGLSMFREFLKPRSTSTQPSCRPDVISAVLASLSARSFSLTLACPG